MVVPSLNIYCTLCDDSITFNILRLLFNFVLTVFYAVVWVLARDITRDIGHARDCVGVKHLYYIECKIYSLSIDENYIIYLSSMNHLKILTALGLP